MSIFDGSREWVEEIIQGAEHIARQHENDFMIGGVFDAIFWIADKIRDFYELLFTYIVPDEHSRDLENLLRSLHEEGKSTHHDFATSIEQFSTEFLGLGSEAYINAAKHASLMHQKMLDAFEDSFKHHADISANLAEAAFAMPLLTGGTEVGFGALATTVASGGTSSPATVPGGALAVGDAAASGAVVVSTLLKVATAITILGSIAVTVYAVTQPKQFQQIVDEEIAGMIALTLEIAKLAEQFDESQKKTFAEAMQKLKDQNLALPKEIVILLVFLGFTADEIVEIAKLWDYINKYAGPKIEAFLKRLFDLHMKYPDVPIRDIVYLLVQGYTDADVARILPEYSRLKDQGLQDLFDNGLKIDQPNISKGANREIATIIAIDAKNIQTLGVKIPNTTRPGEDLTDLDIVLNNNGGVIQVGGAGGKVGKRDRFDTQFTAAFDYSKGKAFLYLQTGPKGKSDPDFQKAYRWVVEDMTTIYEKQGKSPDEATKLANSYANYHVRPIGYPYQDYATPDLYNNPYPPNVPAAPGNPYP